MFFYQSPYNGRVFFDELGPPWPKHPCTDIQRGAVHKFSNSAGVQPMQFGWQKAGWQPVIIEEIEHVKDWARLKLRPMNPDKGGFIIRATPWHEGIKLGLPAHIKPLDEFGIGRISMLQLTHAGSFEIKGILVHRVFTACECVILKRALKQEANAIFRVAEASYKDWGTKGVQPGTVSYPAFVDFAVAKCWVRAAAHLGSQEAQTALENHSKFRPGSTQKRPTKIRG